MKHLELISDSSQKKKLPFSKISLYFDWYSYINKICGSYLYLLKIFETW